MIAPGGAMKGKRTWLFWAVFIGAVMTPYGKHFTSGGEGRFNIMKYSNTRGELSQMRVITKDIVVPYVGHDITEEMSIRYVGNFVPFKTAVSSYTGLGRNNIREMFFLLLVKKAPRFCELLRRRSASNKEFEIASSCMSSIVHGEKDNKKLTDLRIGVSRDNCSRIAYIHEGALTDYIITADQNGLPQLDTSIYSDTDKSKGTDKQFGLFKSLIHFCCGLVLGAFGIYIIRQNNIASVWNVSVAVLLVLIAWTEIAYSTVIVLNYLWPFRAATLLMLPHGIGISV
jgi:hypothetical protein